MNKLPKKTQVNLHEYSYILPGDITTLQGMILEQISRLEYKTLDRMDILEAKIDEALDRLGKIEVELSKRHIVGINNLILSDDVIDEIWDEKDDTI